MPSNTIDVKPSTCGDILGRIKNITIAPKTNTTKEGMKSSMVPSNMFHDTLIVLFCNNNASIQVHLIPGLQRS